MTFLSEHITSREFTVGSKQKTVELTLILHDCPDSAQAESLLLSSSPTHWPTQLAVLVRTSVAAKPLSDTLWEGTVTYGDSEAPQNQEKPKAGDIKVGYRIGSTTHKVRRSKKTVASYSAAGKGTAPDFLSSVNVEGGATKGKVNGTDVRIPTFQLVISGYFLRSQLTSAYRQQLGRLVHTVNDKPFFGFARGELLFDGADFEARTSSLIAEVQFVFAHEPNIVEKVPLRFVSSSGAILAVEVEIPKNGWDYLWIFYTPQEVDVPLTVDAVPSLPGKPDTVKVLIQQPTYAYVEQMYDYLDWGGSGTSASSAGGPKGLGLGDDLP